MLEKKSLCGDDLCISILEFKLKSLFNFFNKTFNLCISILEFKYILQKFNIFKFSNLCISILEFKFKMSSFIFKIRKIYVFLY